MRQTVLLSLEQYCTDFIVGAFTPHNYAGAKVVARRFFWILSNEPSATFSFASCRLGRESARRLDHQSDDRQSFVVAGVNGLQDPGPGTEAHRGPPTEMDCTQANAVPGPSRLPYASPQAGLEAVQTYSSPPPPAPSLPVVDPSGSQAPTQAVLDARPPAKPRIVPTVVAADGVREVPHAFELCEVEDLITLIGESGTPAVQQ